MLDFQLKKKSLKRGWKMRWRLPLAYLWRRLRTEDCICRDEIRLRTTEKTPKNTFSLNKKKQNTLIKWNLICVVPYTTNFASLKKQTSRFFPSAAQDLPQQMAPPEIQPLLELLLCAKATTFVPCHRREIWRERERSPRSWIKYIIFNKSMGN